MKRRHKRITLGADKNYDTQQMVASLRAIGVTPHVAQNEHQHRSSAIDDRTTRHPGYAMSQRKRKRVEEIFGWIKDRGRVAQDQASRAEASWLDVHVRGGGLQPGSVAESRVRDCLRAAGSSRKAA